MKRALKIKLTGFVIRIESSECIFNPAKRKSTRKA